MGGLFDGIDTGGTLAGAQASATDGALFPAAPPTPAATPALFPDEAAGMQAANRPTGQPAFPQTVPVTALPLDGVPTAGQRAPSVSAPAPSPLLLNDSPTVPQTAPKTAIEPVTIASDAPPVQQRAATVAVQPQEIFQEPEDPLVHKALQHAREKYPEAFERGKRLFKARFETLLPLDFDRIATAGSRSLPQVQGVLREVSESSLNFSALSVSATISEITTAAREAAARSNAGGTTHGLGGLLKRVEQSVRHFDADAAQGTLMRLHGGVKSIHGRLSISGNLAQETLTAMQTDIMVMSVIATMAENTSLAQQTQRRHELLLITGQELQLAQKQLEALRAQTENALMQIEEVRTVTLPSLGFLGAIRG